MKSKTVFCCAECGYESPKWQGKCPVCSAWNVFFEVKVEKTSSKTSVTAKHSSTPKLLQDVEYDDNNRVSTSFSELDRVLGGGICEGSVNLIGGEPGIGKSTLLLQICDKLDKSGVVLYISAEESLSQLKLRAERLNIKCENLYLLAENDIETIFETIKNLKPQFIIVDSIQTIYSSDLASSAGSVGQVRECTATFINYAKQNNTSVFIVGHITKDGLIAGPKTLEHMVDCVLYFEGEKHSNYRILRTNKNRFGPSNEIGVFEMTEGGLLEVLNPSRLFLDGRPKNSAGSVAFCALEGTRPIIVEIQALITPTHFNMPRRMTTGIDINRLNLMLAVLEKRVGYPLSTCDAYVNVTGGLKIDEPSLDLAVCLAIASGFKNVPLGDDLVVFGEIGLSGEVRSVSGVLKRLAEIEKLEFKRCVLPHSNVDQNPCKTIELLPVRAITEAITKIM